MDDKTKLQKIFKNCSLLFPLNSNEPTMMELINIFCIPMIKDCIQKNKNDFDETLKNIEELDNMDFYESNDCKNYIQKIKTPVKINKLIDLFLPFDKYNILCDVQIIVQSYLSVVNNTRKSFDKINSLNDKQYCLLAFLLFTSIEILQKINVFENDLQNLTIL